MKKNLLLLLVLLLAASAYAEQNDIAQCRTVQCNANLGPVNAIDFGKITINSGYNSGQATANRIAIQSAIDYSIAEGRQVINLPCGVFWIDAPLFVDRAVNRRNVTGAANNGFGLVRLTVATTAGWSTNDKVTAFLIGGTTEANGTWAITVIDGTHVDLQGSTFSNVWTSGGTVYNPISFGFSAWLQGCGGPGNNANYGTVIKPVANLNAPYIVFGPGTGMGGSGFAVLGTILGAACSLAYPNQSVGIAYAAGSGGGTRFELDKVGVYSAKSLIGIGWDGNGALADRTLLSNIDAQHGYYGLNTIGGEPFIVNLDNSSIAANYSIYNSLGLNINVRGGAYALGSTHYAVFRSSNTSALSAASPSYTLTTTVASSDPQLDANCYNAFAIKTTHFGTVPATLVSNSKGAVTLRLLDSWVVNNFGNLNVPSDTDLQAELQAATQLFATEKYTIFYGQGINVDGVHIEGGYPLALIDTSVGQQPTVMRNIRMNMDPGDSRGAACLGQGTNCEAQYLVQQTSPFMNLGNGYFTLSDFYSSSPTPSDPFIIDAKPQGGGVGQPIDYEFSRLYKATPLIRWWTFRNENDESEQYFANRYKGSANWDHSYWLYQNSTISNLAKIYLNASDDRTPFMGFRPAPWVNPTLTPSQYTNVSGVLPALGTYPLIHGGTIYQVAKEGDTSVRRLVASTHQFYSWGQNLTANWSYKGASNVVDMGIAVMGAANNGSGLIRLTVGSTAAWSTGQTLTVNGIVGTTEANRTTPWTITVVDDTHIDLQGSTFTNAYVRGGRASDTSMMFAGLAITLNFAAADHQFLVTGVYPGQGFITITNPTPITSGTDTVTVNPGNRTIIYTGTTIKQQPYTWTSVTLQ